MLKAVVFDMDGVIADSEPIHVEAEKTTFRKHGVEASDVELHAFTGSDNWVMLRTMIDRYRLPLKLDALYREHMVNLFDAVRKHVQPFPGALDLIRGLSENGVPLAVASSSPRKLIDLVLEKFDVACLFHTIVSGDDVSLSKPNPEIFAKAATRLGLQPRECLAIEDSTNGVRAAKEAGMAVIGFKNANSLNQNLDGADAVVDGLLQIDAVLLARFGLSYPALKK